MTKAYLTCRPFFQWQESSHVPAFISVSSKISRPRIEAQHCSQVVNLSYRQKAIVKNMLSQRGTSTKTSVVVYQEVGYSVEARRAYTGILVVPFNKQVFVTGI